MCLADAGLFLTGHVSVVRTLENNGFASSVTHVEHIFIPPCHSVLLPDDGETLGDPDASRPTCNDTDNTGRQCHTTTR